MTEAPRPPRTQGHPRPRTAVPDGAWSAGHEPLTPTAGHGVVIGVTIGLSAALVVGSTAIGGGLISLLVLLLAIGALVVPVALVVTLWNRARPANKVLFTVAGAASLLLLVWAVTRIAEVLPTVTFPLAG